MVRLLDQHRMLTECMGGPCSERSDLGEMRNILDIACGPGGWVLDIAHRYPNAAVIGVDISTTVINYAKGHAQVQKLPNASFKVMNILDGLAFLDNSMDMVNARLLFGFMPQSKWPWFIQECMRVLRPGGVIRLTEAETNFCSKPAFQSLTNLVTALIRKAGLSYSPDGNQPGISPVLGSLLRRAGFEHINRRAYALDYSFGELPHAGMIEDVFTGLSLVKPRLTQLGLVTPAQFDELYQQAQMEALADDFCALWFIYTVWGSKAQAIDDML